MTTDTKLELSSDTILVKLYGGVTGVTRRTDDEKTTHLGVAVETQRTVTTRQADAQEAERAKKLLNKLRTVVDSYCTSILNLTVTTAGQLGALRAEVAPVQAQIDTHNRGARYHKIDRALICAPIGLKADPAALAAVCGQIADELRAARAFFELVPADPSTAGFGEALPPALPGGADSLARWLTPVDNWRQRTAGLDKLFPTITGQMIGEALESVATLRSKVANVARAFEKAGQSPESALRSALQSVTAEPGALGYIDNALGFVVVTDSQAKEAAEEAAAEGNSIEVH